MTQNTEENNNEPPEKKIKTGTINDVNQIIEKKAKDQNKDFSVLRDRLKMRLTKEDFVTILTQNGQYVPKDESVRLYWRILLEHIDGEILFFKTLDFGSRDWYYFLWTNRKMPDMQNRQFYFSKFDVRVHRSRTIRKLYEQCKTAHALYGQNSTWNSREV